MRVFSGVHGVHRRVTGIGAATDRSTRTLMIYDVSEGSLKAVMRDAQRRGL